MCTMRTDIARAPAVAALLVAIGCFQEFDRGQFDVAFDAADAPEADVDAAPDTDAEVDGDGGHCAHGVCCDPGATCCAADEHCVLAGQHLACDTRANACYEACGPGGTDDDRRCATGYHCDANRCMDDIVLGVCDENSDCVSGDCRANYCCERAGLCCAEDADCPDLFDGCATDTSRTCVFSAWTFPDTGLGGQCYNMSDELVACSTIGTGMDYHGQDGHHPGPGRSFSSLGDGRVRDGVTLRVWTQTVAPSGMSWTDARDHCRGLGLAGSTWRLPYRHELLALVNYLPGAGAGLDSPFEAVGVTKIWTGTLLAGGESSTAWVVDAQTGTVERLGRGSTLPHVLCVED